MKQRDKLGGWRFSKLAPISGTMGIIGLVMGICAVDAQACPGDAGRLDALCEVTALADENLSPIDRLQLVVNRATEITGEASTSLLPVGSDVDDLMWIDNVANVFLTLPDWPADETLSPIDAEALTDALAATIHANDPGAGGIQIHVRLTKDGAYDAWDTINEEKHGPARASLAMAAPATDPDRSQELAYIAGQTTHAVRQPQGALSGVIVYCTGGHGWTMNEEDSVWETQRPVLYKMCEDYGNLDMLNNFVQYAFNAGATVVPFRPVGWQPEEVLLDNDDPGVTFSGTWSTLSGSKYYENGVTNSGVAYRGKTTNTTETGVARYTPDLPTTDFYPVFVFTPPGPAPTKQTYRVTHSGGTSEIVIDHRDVAYGWIWLGTYYFQTGTNGYVEISNASDVAGTAIADAVRFGGGMGDIVRPGPDSISGFPRDQEAQRYFAERTLGLDSVGFDPFIWDPNDLIDISDNVRTAAKWAAEMNQEPAGGVQVDRWKRVYLEFHSNAGGSRGQYTLLTNLSQPTYQVEYATILSVEFDQDMLLSDDDWEYPWPDQSLTTLTGTYGAIAASANNNEFDSTIIEVAFHDDPTDAELLRDPRVRAAMGRACVHGITKFLNTLPDSQVPLAFAPDTPQYVRVEDLGNGDVRIAWEPPLFDEARGEEATGYVVYQSTNGYGFGDPIVLGNVLSTTISNVPVGEPRYFRVAATNAGGESMPSAVLGVCRPSTGVADVLIVSAFDRQRRETNLIQPFTQPAAYAGLYIERQIWRANNSFDYVVQFGEALAANGDGFASCTTDVVQYSYINMDDYDIVHWISGQESSEDEALSSLERTRIQSFLSNGGSIFISGSDLAYDLNTVPGGATFLSDALKIGFSNDYAQTYDVDAAAGGIFDGIASFDFDPNHGAVYDTKRPDIITAGSGATVALNYNGPLTGAAAVQYAGATYYAVTMGFPFEAISSAADRNLVMARVMAFLRSAPEVLQFDWDNDGDVDITDFNVWLFCVGKSYPDGNFCLEMDGDGDHDVDIADFYLMQQEITGAL